MHKALSHSPAPRAGNVRADLPAPPTPPPSLTVIEAHQPFFFFLFASRSRWLESFGMYRKIYIKGGWACSERGCESRATAGRGCGVERRGTQGEGVVSRRVNPVTFHYRLITSEYSFRVSPCLLAFASRKQALRLPPYSCKNLIAKRHSLASITCTLSELFAARLFCTWFVCHSLF